MRIAQTGSPTIGVMIACAAAMLTGCGGSPSVPDAISPPQGAASVARGDAGGCPLKRCIIVTSETAAVLFFARDANGNAKPAGEITGDKTMLGIPVAVAMDSQQNLYVVNSAGSITVYAAGSEGNVAPIRTIEGANTNLDSPTGIAFDSQDELYVANNQGNHINIYAPDANGDVAPIREIRGKKTNLYLPRGLAFDSQSNLYVANDNPNTGWVTVYAPGAHGDATPERTIEGAATKFSGPAGLAVDASGYIYVVNSSLESICIFSPDANGDEAPLSYFSGPIYAFGIGLDAHADMYVTSVGYDDPPSVTVYAAGTTGHEGRALRDIQGKKTKLEFPEGILVR